MAVRLDIRPRIVLRDDAPAPRRRGFRLPPLALPAAGYWALMGAATYFFAQLGPNPLESIEPAQASEPSSLELTPPVPRAPAATASADARLAEEPATGSSVEEAPAAAAPALRAEPEPALEAAPPPERREDTERLARRDRGGNEPESPSAPEEPRVALAFPEFTDSSRPKPRERAADGPRIESLFERAEDPAPTPEAPGEGRPERDRAPARAVTSCEAAVARNNEQLEIGGPRGPADISREAYAQVLQNGSYLSGCSIPPRTVFEICAAVKDGRAVGVTVVSNPANASLNACVRSAVSRLQFPSNPRLDVTHTRFDAVRR